MKLILGLFFITFSAVFFTKEGAFSSALTFFAGAFLIFRAFADDTPHSPQCPHCGKQMN
jgi:hypothetical protein